MIPLRIAILSVSCLALTVAEPEPLIRQIDQEVALAPDGTRLAFISNRDGPLALYVMRLDNFSVTRLTNDQQPNDNPSWSPDSRLLAFVVEANSRSDIHVIAADGSDRRQVTRSGRELHPAWSPDGRRLMLTSLRNSVSPDSPQLDLYMVDLVDGEERRLTFGPTTSYGSWSPDGSRIAFWRMFGGNADIAVADAEARVVRRLTTDPAFDGWPSWSPDGRHIVFAREREGESDIYVLDMEGHEQLAAGGPGRKTGPRWSADGAFIYYSRRHEEQVRIWRVRWRG